MATMLLTLGPKDHGRRLSLDDFEFAQVQEGYRYELARGVLEVSDVPRPIHGRLENAIRRALMLYQMKYPEGLYEVFGPSACKLVIPPFESERHPDLSIYRTPPPNADNPWPEWVPDIVVEVISPDSSEERDTEIKPEEYHAAGVKEYWIVDGERRVLTQLRRWGAGWRRKEHGPGDVLTTRLLPGFRLDLTAVFAVLDR